MDPDAGEAHRDATVGDPENSDTIAQQKKRARRVSFAEMTSVHFFDRDDESNETPPLAETTKLAEDSSVESVLERSQKEFDDSGDVDDEMEIRSSFLRPIGSPSSGGSTIGSAFSIDEDYFFGPVSANFIRPGRLSDSAVSDDLCDVTMDSTAFSMHFRSLATSDSGMDLKTPTEGNLCSKEKTPTNADAGNTMSFTMRKKPVLFSSSSVMEASGTGSSNDMSIIGESNNTYDYGKLSPGLDALLAESRQDLISFGATYKNNDSKSPMTKESDTLTSTDCRESLLSLRQYVRKEDDGINFHEVVSNGYAVNLESDPVKALPLGQSAERSSPKRLDAATSYTVSYKLDKPSHQLINNQIGATLLKNTSSQMTQQETILLAASPSKHLGETSPLEKHGSFLLSECAEHLESQTSIQKSISKLESLEKCAFSSTFSSRVDRSSIKSLDFGKPPDLDALSGKNRGIMKINSLEDSISKLSSYHNKEKGRAVILAVPITGSTSSERHLKDFLGPNSEKPPVDSSISNMFGDLVNHGGLDASLSKATQPRDNFNHSSFKSQKYVEDVMMHQTNSFLAEIASGGGVAETKFTHFEFASPPGRIVEKILSPSLQQQFGMSGSVQSQRQFKHFRGIDKDKDSALEQNLHLLDETANMLAKSPGTTGDLCSSSVGVDSLKNNILAKATSIGNDVVWSPGSVITPAFETGSIVVQAKTLDEVNLVRKDKLEDGIQGKEFNDVRLVPSPKSVERSGVPPKNFAPYKRNLELLEGRTHHSPKMTTMQWNRKIQMGGDCNREAPLYPAKGITTASDNDLTKLADMHLKFSEDIKELISELAFKLNSKAVGDLEDLLVHCQRSQMYDLIHCNIVPKKTSVLDYQRLEKVCEINSFLQRVSFEKARLQLKLARREKLLSRLQQVRYRIQEALKLRADIMCQPLKASVTNIVVEADGKWSLSVISEEKQEQGFNEKLTSMKQAWEALDRKISILKRNFSSSFKMKSGLNSVETISLINEHLKRRLLFRSIRQDMQVWVVDKLGSVDDQYSVVLNYLDFVMQSIKVTLAPTSTVASSVKLNEANIIKNFPSMDACAAFSIVFDTETSFKYIRSKTLPCLTQVTRSLLGTLLDIIEEVQSAQLEFPNLSQSTFSSPSYGQLELKLCFHNFNTGRRAVFRLDLSCLKCGIYPWNVLPLQVVSPLDGSCLPISSETVHTVRAGYMRIYRICQCVSHFVQSQGMKPCHLTAE